VTSLTIFAAPCSLEKDLPPHVGHSKDLKIDMIMLGATTGSMAKFEPATAASKELTQKLWHEFFEQQMILCFDFVDFAHANNTVIESEDLS
jgi:hypothetical protein